MAATAYQLWAAAVAKLGGVVTTLPKDGRAAARYPVEVWGARANAGKWPLPDAYVNPPTPGGRIKYAPGKFTTNLGYYLAPTTAQEAAKRLTELSVGESFRLTAVDIANVAKETGIELVNGSGAVVKGAADIAGGLVKQLALPIALGIGIALLFYVVPTLSRGSRSRHSE